MKINLLKYRHLIIGAVFVMAVFLFSGCTGNADIQQEKQFNNYKESTEAKSFKGYECTDDCSGHEAGYNWAMKKGITDPDDCGGKSTSFIEGCRSYASGN
jgi:uncharacterized lipoprotein